MKKGIKKFQALFFALMLVLSMAFVPKTAYAEGTKADVRFVNSLPADMSGKTVILHTNDVHGAVKSYAQVTALKYEIMNRGAEVILADVGDFSQGTPYVSTSFGAYAVVFMNTAGYDIATIGNHDFDYGVAQLQNNLSYANFKLICANVYTPDGKLMLDPNYVFTLNSGLKIGFFGLDTPETQTKVNPVKIKGTKFLSGTDLYACAQNQVNELKAQGCDLVICLSHLGIDEETALEGNRSTDVYANTTGIDMIIDGHSHAVMTEGEGGEPVTSTGTKLENIGAIVIDNASKTIEDHYLLSTEGIISNPTTEYVINKITDIIDSEYDVEFAQSEVELNGNKAPGVRTGETNLGDLIADAIKWSVMKDKGSLTVPDDHVVAITNSGGIRASISAGGVTKKDLNTVLPFGNTVSVIYVTGAEMLEALEASTFCTPDPIGGFPQVSGIKYTIDSSVPFDKGEGYPDSTYFKPASIKRVTIDSINGKPFSATDTYAVVTNDFVAVGGDTYFVFGNATQQFDTGILMDEAVIDYVQTELQGQIKASQYGEPAGNITIK